MGNNTQKRPITKKAVFDRMNDELEKLDGKQNQRSLLIRAKR